jgi:predicted kinase
MVKRLIITVGYPRCGKSTWAQGTGFPVVSSDAIRLALFGSLWSEAHEHLVLPLARTMVRALFHAGHERVIWDSVNVTRALRAFWRPNPDLLWERTYQIFARQPLVCKDRADITGKPYLKAVIDRMHAIYEPVAVDEYGWAAIEGRGEEDFAPGASI